MRGSVAKRFETGMRGFTLVELVVAMTLTAIVIGYVAIFMAAPVDVYMDQSGRSALTESTQVITRSLAKDLRSALPNSVRTSNVGGRAIVEMLAVEAISFYQTDTAVPPLANANRELDVSGAADASFSAFGHLNPTFAVNYNLTSHLVVGNWGTGQAGHDAYQLNGVLLSNGLNILVTRIPAGEEAVTVAAGPGLSVPVGGDLHNRLFVVSGPVTYICNSNTRTLQSFRGYPITGAMPTSENSLQLLGSTVTVIATNVAACQLSCRNGINTNVCDNTLIAEITVDRATNSGTESIRMFEQFPVDNSR